MWSVLDNYFSISSSLLERERCKILDPNISMKFEVELKALNYISEEISGNL